MLPWISSEYSDASGGYPVPWLSRLALYLKGFQSAMNFVITMSYPGEQTNVTNLSKIFSGVAISLSMLFLAFDLKANKLVVETIEKKKSLSVDNGVATLEMIASPVHHYAEDVM